MNSSTGCRVLSWLAGYCLCLVLLPSGVRADVDSCGEALRVGDACERMEHSCSALADAAEHACHGYSFLPESGDCDYLRRGSEICSGRVEKCLERRNLELDKCAQTQALETLLLQ